MLDVNSSLFKYILLTIIVIILIIIIFVLKKMSKYQYLNYNSTFFGGNCQFNPSDIAYEEVAEELDKQSEIIEFIKKILNAGEDAKVIFTSGATEGIATVMHWCNYINKYGIILGSRLDHESVKANAENYGYKYKILDVDNIKNINNIINDNENISMIFMTHVSSKTGEIYPLDQLPKMQYLSKTFMAGGNEPENLTQNIITLQQKPIRVLDITQSIGKIPIDMQKYDINAVMFSMHKLGGEFNTGVLVIRDTFKHEFVPLIAGSQQNNLRGGTYNSYAFDQLPLLLKDYPYNYNDCKERWITAEKYISENLNSESRLKPKLIKPTLNHVYNTFLIQLNDCGLGIIKKLSDDGIYISSSSACSTKNKDKFIRISFLKSSELSNETLKKIINEINNS